MRKFKSILKTKITLISGVVAGLIVGGAATAAVMAVIPDNNGVIHGCYKNKDGSLRVIDSSNNVCSNGETALNWDQSSPQAYAHIVYDTNISDNVLDANRSKNVTLSTGGQIFCLTVSFTPKTLSATGDGDIVGFKDQDGWTSPEAAVCDTQAPGSNVAFTPISDADSSFFVSFFR